MRLAEPARFDEAKGLLASIGSTDRGPLVGTLEVKVDDGAHALVAVVRALDGAGIEPLELGLREPTLDDVFLQLTGRATTEEAV